MNPIDSKKINTLKNKYSIEEKDYFNLYQKYKNKYLKLKQKGGDVLLTDHVNNNLTQLRNRPKLDNLLSNIKKLDDKTFYDVSYGNHPDTEKFYFLSETIKKNMEEVYEETHFKQLIVDFRDVPQNALFINLKKEDGEGEYYDGMNLLYKIKEFSQRILEIGIVDYNQWSNPNPIKDLFGMNISRDTINPFYYKRDDNNAGFIEPFDMSNYEKGTKSHNIKDLNMSPNSKVILIDQYLLELIVPKKYILNHVFTKHRLKGLLKFYPYLINYEVDESNQSWIYVNTGITQRNDTSTQLRLCYYGTLRNIEQELQRFNQSIIFNHTTTVSQ